MLLKFLYILIILLLVREISKFLKIIKVLDNKKLETRYKILTLMNFLVIVAAGIALVMNIKASKGDKLEFILRQSSLFILLAKSIFLTKTNKEVKDIYL